MSDFVDMLTEMLPMHSSLQNKDNQLRKVLDYTVGEYMDNLEQPFDMLFLDTATGGWLDSFGRDYGIFRKPDESDDDYRTRIVYEKKDNLTANFLTDIYNVGLFSYRSDFNVKSNTLVSDNPYVTKDFIGICDEDTIQILDSKYVIDTGVTWVNIDGEIEYILDINGVNLLSEYSKIYRLTDLTKFCKDNVAIEKVKLDLPNAINCYWLFNGCSALSIVELNVSNCTDTKGMFSYCSSLSEIELDLPNVVDGRGMFAYCTGLKNVKLNLPNIVQYSDIFGGTGNIETIDVTIPTNIVDGFKAMVFGATPHLTHLTSFKINGEEQL